MYSNMAINYQLIDFKEVIYENNRRLWQSDDR